MLISSYRHCRFPLLDAICTQARIQFYVLLPWLLFWLPQYVRFFILLTVEILYNFNLALQGRPKSESIVIASYDRYH